MYPSLFQPLRLGDLTLPNRVLMAPLTRNRADDDQRAPHDLHVRYYAQRASAGLIFTEATQISQEGTGYIRTPGIHTEAQVHGWQKVTQAVHDAGGRIFLQLWHVGLRSHPSFQKDGGLPVAPSAVPVQGRVFTAAGYTDIVTPRALLTEEIPRVVQDFRHAAALARQAGFDGVEIHGANGYLIDQFLRDGANQRTDAYGGSLEGRLRFLREVIAAVLQEWPAQRIGVRLSPENTPWLGYRDSAPEETFTAAARLISSFGLAYLHVVENVVTEQGPRPLHFTPQLREAFAGPLIANGGYTAQLAADAVESGQVDAVAFGRLFIANPDLPRRIQEGAPLNSPDPSTFFSGEEKGYTDYPAWGEG